ncbi:HNH endonuclease signature motif containing protein [Streptomyces coeruleorubidus]|uniref:HNH endonuclease signature motif containing protein n=1 Tax=Streptomyces coeruleorubidus TaxID=116188 RepID=UPI0033CB88E9
MITLPTGTGKTVSGIEVAIKMARLGLGRTVVVRDRHSVAEFEKDLWAAWAGLGEAAISTAAPASLRLYPEPYTLRRLRARLTPEGEYRALCRRAEEWEASGRDQERREVSGEERVRNPASRQAVLFRSGGLCENPECLLPNLPYRTTAGKPLLEADHIDEHASGGRDHPAAMIALCPNCHSNKTHGAGKSALTELLRKVAAQRHADEVATRV